MIPPVVIGIAGGSASGKTSVAAKLRRQFAGDVVLLTQDNYYRSQAHLSPAAREAVNYDQPDAFDNQLLQNHLEQLIAGRTIAQPVYDFATHTRTAQQVKLTPKPVILVEGIFVLANANLRSQLDIRLFIDTPADIRLLRRLKRDVQQRGRSLAAVERQYLDSVRPAYERFIAPSRAFADVIIPDGAHNQVAIDLVAAKIQTCLAKRRAR